MINAPYEREFVFHDGSRSKNILELIYKIESMSDGEFNNFVNPYKNDFANWIEHVFSNKSLANELRNTISKTTTLRLLKDEISRADVSEASSKMTHGVTFGSSIVHSKHTSTHEHHASPHSNLHPANQNNHTETHHSTSHPKTHHDSHHVHHTTHNTKEHEHRVEHDTKSHHIKEESHIKSSSKNTDSKNKDVKQEIKNELVKEKKSEDKKEEKRSLFKSLLGRHSKDSEDNSSDTNTNSNIKPKKLDDISSYELHNSNNTAINKSSKSNEDDKNITQEYIAKITNPDEKQPKKWFKLFSRKDLSEEKLETLEHKEELKKKPELELGEEIKSDARENTLWVVLYISLVLLIITLLVYKLFLS